MAEEKDTDSAPEDGVTESSAAASSPRHGAGPESPDELETPDESAAEDQASDDASDDSVAEADAELEIPEELRDDADELSDDDPDESDDDSDDDRELVGAGVASKAAGGSGGAQVARSAGRSKKGKPTPKQRSGADKPKRMTPLEFVRGSISELKKVVYPTGSQLWNYFVVVLIFVALMIAIVMVLDYGFGWLMLRVFA